MGLWSRIAGWLVDRDSGKIGGEPAGYFHPLKMPDGRVALVDQTYLDYVRSTAPAPTQASLEKLLAHITRVRLIDAGMGEPGAKPGPVLFDSSAPETLTALRQHLAIVEDPAGFGHCMCFGSQTFELYQGQALAGAIGLHHGVRIRWAAWKDDAPLADPQGLLRWMDGLGAAGPLQDFEQARARAEQGAAQWAKWLRALPSSLEPFRGVLEQVAWQGWAPLDAPAMLAAMGAQYPDPGASARALFAWFGAGAGLWSGCPSYESVPEELLLACDTRALLDSLENRELTAAEAEGAARYFGGWDFRNKKEGEARPMSPALRKLLLEAGSRTEDADRLARAQAAFGGP
jgi:hypothetical protein